MNTSSELQLNYRNLKETEEGMEVHLFLQNLKCVYNINEVVGTYICSKVKNIINNFRHKAKRAIYEELKANKIVSSKLDSIVASALSESNFEKLFEYYSGVSYSSEFSDNIVPVCSKFSFNSHEACENSSTATYLHGNQNMPIANSSLSKIDTVSDCIKANNKDTKRVIVEYIDDSYIVHLKPFNSISNLKNLLCQEMNLKKETLKDTTIKYFSNENKNWADIKSWGLLKQDESLRIFYQDKAVKESKPLVNLLPDTYDANKCDSPKNDSKPVSAVHELIEEYKRSSANTEWIKEFRFPKFDAKVTHRMEEGKPILASERTKICQIIMDNVKKINKINITGKEIQLILKWLFVLYPRLYDPEKDKWITFNIWKVILEGMSETHAEKDSKVNSTPKADVEPITKSKSNKLKRKSLSSISTQKKKKKEERSSRVSGNEELSDDDSSGRRGKMMISAGMSATFEERRMQIVSENWSIEDIFASYPWLYNENEIFAEFSRIVKGDFQVDKIIESGLKKLTDPLLYILKSHHKSRIVAEKEKEIKAVEKKNKSNNFDYKMALFGLPLAIGEEVETIFKQSGSYYDEPIQIEFTGSDLYDNGKAYSVIIESSKIECSNLKKAVAVYFCSFFIFNLAYPSDIKKFLYAIERYILNIPGKSPPPVSVVKLFDKIEEFVTGENSSVSQ